MRPTLRRFPVLLVLLAGGPTPAWADEAGAKEALDRDTAGRILGRALVDDRAWERLSHLTTRIGHRLAGSAGLDAAVRWAEAEMQREGLERVRLQPARVPRWVRGREWARVVSPIERELAILGLGLSVGTPREGITAPVVVVRSFEELAALGREKVEGRIVAFTPDWEGYGKTVRFRTGGASAAGRLGAVAVLVRSATGRSIGSPHTGALSYAEGVPRIPAAAITVEDAEWMRRLAAAGETLRVSLSMEARLEGEVESANVLGEIRGRERPEEVVVMGGHYDSWDVGQGAHDDGCGCVAAWSALSILKDLGLRPRRTLRVALFTAEESTGAGARAYRAALGGDTSSHVAAIEMDGGCERPTGFGFTVRRPAGAPAGGGAEDPESRAALHSVAEIGRLLSPLGAGAVRWGGGGADIAPLTRDGVPGLSVDTVGERYFDWHHTHGDTIDKVDPDDLRKATAMLALMGYALAERESRLVPAP